MNWFTLHFAAHKSIRIAKLDFEAKKNRTKQKIVIGTDVNLFETHIWEYVKTENFRRFAIWCPLVSLHDFYQALLATKFEMAVPLDLDHHKY